MFTTFLDDIKIKSSMKPKPEKRVTKMKQKLEVQSVHSQ